MHTGITQHSPRLDNVPHDAPEVEFPPDGHGRSPAGILAPFIMVHDLSRDGATAVCELVTTVAASGGHTPINPERLQRAVEGSAAGYLGALAWDPSRTTKTGSRPLVGYAQALRSAETWDIELVTRLPGAPALEARMLRAVRDALAAQDDATVRLWRYQATEEDDRLARLAGLAPTREIRQLRRSLPLPATDTDTAAQGRHQRGAIRTFRPGQDEEAWLEVNRRAFAWHPDQGDVTLSMLTERQAAPWFDPQGFLLYEVDGQLAGFCWTKVHRDAQPPLGEIYVIGVDPSWHGRGLGKTLLVAGLDHLARAELDVAMLYVEATNEPALQLYERLGFKLHHVDKLYEAV